MQNGMNEEATLLKSNVLGVEISCIDKIQLLMLVLEWCKQKRRRTVMYVNAYCLNLAAILPDYRSILNKADLVYADGISVVWASGYLGGCRPQKITGRDWIYDFCSLAAKQDVKIAILGGSPGIVQKAGQSLMERYPNLQIVTTAHGFLSEQEEQDFTDNLAKLAPDVLFIGMGTPKQERWIMQYRAVIAAPVCWAVGATFNYVAGVEKPFPSKLERLPLEWLWRLIMNPKDKWSRYLVGNPLFLLRIIRQKYNIK
jgi:N-acetylglucosaminyldiphosphoundecaprenol N-acetyl-beta-D-mannosaminyltransferase